MKKKVVCDPRRNNKKIKIHVINWIKNDKKIGLFLLKMDYIDRLLVSHLVHEHQITLQCDCQALVLKLIKTLYPQKVITEYVDDRQQWHYSRYHPPCFGYSSQHHEPCASCYRGAGHGLKYEFRTNHKNIVICRDCAKDMMLFAEKTMTQMQPTVIKRWVTIYLLLQCVVVHDVTNVIFNTLIQWFIQHYDIDYYNSLSRLQ